MMNRVKLILSVVSLLLNFNESLSAEGYQSLCDKDIGCECPNGIRRIDCNGRGIRELMLNITFPSQVNTVIFNNNNLRGIKSGTFFGGDQLNELDISFNELDYLDVAPFENLTSLRVLDLSHNSIAFLHDDLFKGLTNLEKLYLGNNRISIFDSTTFESCKNLKILSLENNPILTLDEDAFVYLPALREIGLENTGLAALPDNVFKSNPRLIHINLAQNNLEMVPNLALKSAKAVQSLDLSSNRLKEIVYNDFKSLNTLSLIRLDKMSSLRAIKNHALQDLVSLQYFYCNYNEKLSEIHSTAFTDRLTGAVVDVQEVHLVKNSLTHLSFDLLNWKDVRIIELSRNPWDCDCNLKWLSNVSVKASEREHLRCQTPRRHYHHMIADINPDDFSCSLIWNADLSYLMVSLIIVASSTVVVMALFFTFKCSLHKKIMFTFVPEQRRLWLCSRETP